ncbi:arf-GAP with coiled-coil, ANK repeat and PH domain-containing protein 2 [Nematostella vectensis]|uniref:arf-GAP with coiled-coil, ANK repeat and PH domain-containing protein 2 n=1 Tax=Nematostella vectensis TaxID=45351 RepID=UPI0013902DDF|nr:arf-GAP with coiled-coil, ANK repeat and PH domain-containing protein 2 [Nematostella vectensis]
MTFYDNELSIPELPKLELALDDGPDCYQSLTYWSTKASQIAPALSALAKSVGSYYESGMAHYQSGISVSSAMEQVSKEFQDDPKMSEPISKFSDVLQRIECYRDMLLNQTNLLMLQPLQEVAKEYEKVKDLHLQVLKARDEMHLAWEKFSSCPNTANMQEPSLLDRCAHAMFQTRQNYQQLLLKYIASLKELHTVRKVTLLQKVLEHMLAQFSFFNFGYQTLKDVEPYMNDLFQELHERHLKEEKSLKDDERTQEEVNQKILLQHQRDAQAFGEPPNLAVLAQTVSAMNAGKFFNKIGDLFQSGSFGSKKQLKGASPSEAGEQEWEVIDPVTKDRPERPTTLEKPAGETMSPKKEQSTRVDDASALIKDENQEKVINVVPADLISPTSQSIPRHTLPDTSVVVSTINRSTARPLEWDGCKKGYLRIRQKAFPKSRWPLLYFIVDKKNGQLLAQGQEQAQPSTLESLLLCTVKICDASDVDRNFCFQLISPSSDRVFQALTDAEVQGWISAIQEATADALRNSKAKLQTLARSQLDSAIDIKKEPRCLVLNAAERIRKVEGNKYCADCSAPRPDWASINLGITVCIECSGVHRSMGVHVSKVRSLTLDKWDGDTVEFMEAMGNTKVNKIFEANLNDFPKLTRDSGKHDRQAFIKLKYVEQKFYSPIPAEGLDPEVAEALITRPGDREDELLDISQELEDERSLMGSSPLCLIDDCQDCSNHPCQHSRQFAASQLVVSDSGGEQEDTPSTTPIEPESEC